MSRCRGSSASAMRRCSSCRRTSWAAATSSTSRASPRRRSAIGRTSVSSCDAVSRSSRTAPRIAPSPSSRPPSAVPSSSARRLCSRLVSRNPWSCSPTRSGTTPAPRPTCARPWPAPATERRVATEGARSRSQRTTRIVSSAWQWARTRTSRRSSSTAGAALARKRLVLAGIVGRYPVGGVTWCALQYIAGFQRLGYDVFYLEDTGECNFDPIQNAIATDPAYALDYIRRQLALVGLENSWAYIDYEGGYHGQTRAQVVEACRGADLMVRPEYERLSKIFIDTDPGFTQQAIAEAGEGWYRDFFAAHDALFTFALRVDDPRCTLAETPFRWQPTIQPVELDFWPVTPAPREAPFTTILSWTTDSFPGIGKGKGDELLRLIALPEQMSERIRLAIAGKPPTELLAEHGWELTDALEATIDAEAYRRFIQASKAELGFAKAMYVDTRSGWFSDRTQCYLASGRPALVRETGFDKTIPVGEGLLAFADEAGVLAGLEEIESRYDRHARAARELAAEQFEAAAVVADLLERAHVSVAA